MTIKIIDHIFWPEKKKFLLHEDQDNFWVAYLILEGNCKFEIGQLSGVAKGSQLLICPPDTIFKREALSPLTFHFFRLDLMSINSYSLLQAGLHILNTNRFISDEKVLKQYVYDMSSFSFFIREHIIQDLLLFQNLNDSCTVHEQPQPTTRNSRIIQILDYINGNYQEDIKIGELGKRYYFSVSYLSRLFKHEVGMSPKEYLLSVRLKNVQQLLISTNLPIEEIAELTGFKYGYCLSKIFKKKFNLTPSTFRMKHEL